MGTDQAVWVGLLRGIGPGIRQIPMSELRALCVGLGWARVQTYIQSGNLIFRARNNAASLETDLERAIRRRFGFEVPVVVRSVEDWEGYVRSNPLRDVAEREPDRVLLALAKSSPPDNAQEVLQARAVAGEQVARVGEALWIYFPNGVARSKLVPGLLDRLVGSAVTTRNWRTVLRLQALAAHERGDSENWS